MGTHCSQCNKEGPGLAVPLFMFWCIGYTYGDHDPIRYKPQTLTHVCTRCQPAFEKKGFYKMAREHNARNLDMVDPATAVCEWTFI